MIRSHFICLRLYKRVRNLAIPLFQIGFEGALYIRILRRNDASIYSPFASYKYNQTESESMSTKPFI